MPIVLTATWNFLKAHWQAILLVFVVVAGYGWIRHQSSLNAQAIAKLNTAHQVEIDTINKARQDETTQHQQELQQLQTSLDQLQQQYAQAQAALQVQQKQEQAQIVKQYGNDVSGLAQLAASKLGFTVQLPADEGSGK